MTIKRLLIVPVALLAWLTIAAIAMLPGSIKTAFILAGSAELPANVALIDTRGPLWVVYSEDPDYVRALYKGGATFVLPARKKTCLNLQSA